MPHMRASTTALVGLLALCASAPARAGDPEAQRLYALALDRLLKGQARIMRLADPIRIAAAPFCGRDVVPVLGLYAAHEHTFEDMNPKEMTYEEGLRDAAIERFQLDGRHTVLLVVPDLPAARAGLRPGDVVVEVQGRKPRRATRLDALRRAGKDGPIRMTVEREGALVELELERRPGCAPPSRFWFGTTVNAFATHFHELTGTYVYAGMLDLFESDDELATILGHELAHMILRHTQQVTTKGTEADADYLGVYLAARAGFDVTRAIDVEDRLGGINPFSTIDWGFYSHPMSPARSLELRAAIREIVAKQDRGDPLEPEER